MRDIWVWPIKLSWSCAFTNFYKSPFQINSRWPVGDGCLQNCTCVTNVYPVSKCLASWRFRVWHSLHISFACFLWGWSPLPSGLLHLVVQWLSVSIVILAKMISLPPSPSLPPSWSIPFLSFFLFISLLSVKLYKFHPCEIYSACVMALGTKWPLQFVCSNLD